MAVKRRKYKEEKLIDKFERELSRGENICYFAMDLVSEDYNPIRLVELAREKGLAQRLGYLAEVCAEATRLMHLPDENGKLTRLYKGLEGSFDDWQYLEEALVPDWGKRIMRSRVGSEDSSIRGKWKIYSLLEPEEVEDFLDLYVTFDYEYYSPLERHDMMMKGRHYTREVVRNGRKGTRI